MISLIQALRLPGLPRVAFAGAGGKTTAMFEVARGILRQNQVQYPAKSCVFVTTTTHLAVEQVSLSDRHYVVDSPTDLAFLEEALPPGVLLFTGPVDEPQRMRGLEAPVLDKLLALGDAHRVPLLVEADGSRQRPLKAPAEHEPPIPGFVDTVIVVVGLYGLGKPLIDEWVHRPQLFAVLAGMEFGEQVAPEALCRLLLAPEGGLKNIPTEAYRIALLNQADTPEQRSLAKDMVRNLLSGYHNVVVTSLLPPSNSAGQGVDKASEDYSFGFERAPLVYSVHKRVAGIILAAGGSKRYGAPKQLLDWHGQPMVRHVAQTALRAGLDPVVVVTGAHSSDIEDALRGIPVIIAHNLHWDEGQSTSLQQGMRALPSETGAVIFFLVDQPQVPIDLVQALVELHSTTLSPIVAPMVEGRRSNPVLFDRNTFVGLYRLRGDVGGRMLLSEGSGYNVTWLSWDDPDLLLDVDEPQDYARLLRRNGVK